MSNISGLNLSISMYEASQSDDGGGQGAIACWGSRGPCGGRKRGNIGGKVGSVNWDNL